MICKFNDFSTLFYVPPAIKALISPIELATGKQAYFVGKPNPLMITKVVYQIVSKMYLNRYPASIEFW